MGFCIPDDSWAHPRVLVYEKIPHTAHLAPGNLGVPGLDLFGSVSLCLTNDDETIDHSLEGASILNEGLEIDVLGVRNDVLDGFQDITQPMAQSLDDTDGLLKYAFAHPETEPVWRDHVHRTAERRFQELFEVHQTEQSHVGLR